MYRPGSVFAMVALAASAGAAHALTPVRIITPAPDSVVRGSVPIQIPASAVPNTSPAPGYVVIAIDGQFEAAVARPRRGSVVSYVWDTKALRNGQSAVQDGKHEIRVTAMAQNGRPVGNTDRVEVFVQNDVRNAPSSVVLRHRFAPGTQNTYVQRIEVKQDTTEVYKARLVLRRITDDAIPGAYAMVRERIDRDSAQSEQGQPVPFATAGQSVSFNVTSNGGITPGLKMRRTGQKAVMDLPMFPPRPVREGEAWNAPIRLAPMYQGIDGLTLPAETVKHTLTNFEWQNGAPTAKINSTFNGTAQAVVQGAPTLYRVNGKRTTFFDYRSGRVIKMVDDYTLSTTDVSAGTVTLGTSGSGATGAPPGYISANPYLSRGPAAGGGATGTDIGTVKVTVTTQLSG